MHSKHNPVVTVSFWKHSVLVKICSLCMCVNKWICFWAELFPLFLWQRRYLPIHFLVNKNYILDILAHWTNKADVLVMVASYHFGPTSVHSRRGGHPICKNVLVPSISAFCMSGCPLLRQSILWWPLLARVLYSQTAKSTVNFYPNRSVHD